MDSPIFSSSNGKVWATSHLVNTTTTALLRDLTAGYVELRDKQAQSQADLWALIQLSTKDFSVVKQIQFEQPDLEIGLIVKLVRNGYSEWFVEGNNIRPYFFEVAEYKVIVKENTLTPPTTLQELLDTCSFLCVTALKGKGNGQYQAN